MSILTISRSSTIEYGSSPFQLLWKDPQTARYFIDTDKDGTVRTIQEVTVCNKIQINSFKFQ